MTYTTGTVAGPDGPADSESTAPAAAAAAGDTGADLPTVDEATGRPYDPNAERGQSAVAEALGKLPEGYDPEKADRVPAEDKLPGVPYPPSP